MPKSLLCQESCTCLLDQDRQILLRDHQIHSVQPSLGKDADLCWCWLKPTRQSAMLVLKIPSC